jgi:Cdc6-like AAA superfamily ATPase
MGWIVLGEENGRIKLVSKNETSGLLPKGAFLTVETENGKFILRVDDSRQNEPYSPSPMIVDMDLSPLKQDQKCQNLVYAYRIKDLSERDDGLISYIPPQSIARRSNQEEINLSLGVEREGPKVFLATVYAGQNQVLCGDDGKPIMTSLPVDMFFHQMLICGKTGSGKTVATKYLAQYFVENLEGFGAVLAINVKDVDFLKMDKASKITDYEILKEWETLGQKSHGIDNFTIYYPANTTIESSQGVNSDICKKITLNVRNIEPESLTGLLQGITDKGAQSLPNIFRYWQDMRTNGDESKFTFSDFVNYFVKGGKTDKLVYQTLNSRGDESEVTLHRGTYDNIARTLDSATDFFDNENATTLEVDDVLHRGKMSVINVAGSKGIQFGSILLRHLLHGIVNEKSLQKSKIPILLIIDEVHQFYNSNSSREALGDLDTICRTGRSQKIGVIFSSQNPSDIPRGLSSVINTKIFFKSDASSAKDHGVKITSEEMECLKKGYAAANIHELSQLKILKFPLAFAGVFNEGE